MQLRFEAAEVTFDGTHFQSGREPERDGITGDWFISSLPLAI